MYRRLQFFSAARGRLWSVSHPLGCCLMSSVKEIAARSRCQPPKLLLPSCPASSRPRGGVQDLLRAVMVVVVVVGGSLLSAQHNKQSAQGGGLLPALNPPVGSSIEARQGPMLPHTLTSPLSSFRRSSRAGSCASRASAIPAFFGAAPPALLVMATRSSAATCARVCASV